MASRPALAGPGTESRRFTTTGRELRVLHAIPGLESEYGGPTTIIRTLLPLLAGMGVRSEVVTTSAALGRRSGVVTAFDPDLAARVHCFPRYHLAGWRYAYGLQRWLRQEVSRFDLVHVRSLYNFPTLVTCRAAKLAGVPRLFEPQGSVSRWSRSFKAYKKLPYLRLVERGVVLGSEGGLVTHDMESRDLQSMKRDTPARIFRVPPPVVSPPQSMISAEGRPESLLFLSRLHPKKGLEQLMHAYAGIAGECGYLAIAGNGDATYVAEIRALAERLGIARRVEFLGHVEGTAKEEAFAAAGLFVLPSHDENFGIAVVEAVARGVPVVASDAVAAALDLAKDGYARLFPSRDKNELELALLTAWRDREWRRYVYEEGPKYIRAHYRPGVYAERVIEAYRELLNPDSAD